MWREMKSRGPNVMLAAVAVLLLLCWAISYGWMVRIGLAAAVGEDRYECCLFRGIVCVTVIQNLPSPEERSFATRPTGSFIATHWDMLYWDDSWAGVGAEQGSVWLYGEHGQSVNVQCSSVALPFYLLTLALAAKPGWELLRRWRKQWRTMRGRCSGCGYPWIAAGAECPICVARAHLISPTPRTRLVSPIA
jgi:hypothetical protein